MTRLFTDMFKDALNEFAYNDFDIILTRVASLASANTAATAPYRAVYTTPLDVSR